MAGLCAAAHATQRGARVLLLEKGDRCGGSMLLSSGVVWRHRELDRFRAECAGGDAELQRIVFEQLDEGLGWLESLGARPVQRETGTRFTTGARFDPRQLTDALLRAAGGEVQLGEPLRERPANVPVVLASGGFHAAPDLVAQHITPFADQLLLRGAPWSTGDGLRLGLAAGGTRSQGMDEFYGRNMPAPPARVGEAGFVALAQLYAKHATVRNRNGETYAARTWSEIDVVQWTARQPDARALYEVPDAKREVRVRDRTVGDMIDAALAAGAPGGRRDGVTEVEVVAGITTTLGGLRIDEHGRVAPGVYAAGADAGGIATGGYASGLAAALVFGRIAAESALSE
jgi:succinate dehydrogenase/fumarate reductase flavoprotein subunit